MDAKKTKFHSIHEQLGAKIVDFAAGIPIVEEAGGKITDFKGNPLTPKTSDVIVSSGKIHAELVELLDL